MAYSCVDCGHLDKSRRIEADNKLSFRYGCSNKGRKYFVVGWIIKGRSEKSQLDSMGCGDWVSQEQLSLFS